MSAEIEKLLIIIENKLDWGPGEQWQSRDFDNLNQQILDETGVSLSASTLRRVWGKVKYSHLPSMTTLDTLSRFAGFDNWRTFIKLTGIKSDVVLQEIPAEKKVVEERNFSGNKIAIIVMILILAGIVGVVAMKNINREVNPKDFAFSGRLVTRKIPNSIIFNYDATASPTDSVYIQQSWDARTRTLVDKKNHQHTSVYFEPGYYHAKLFIGKQVVKENPLIIPTDGWLGLISHQVIPVYLQSSEFLTKDSLGLKVADIKKKNISMEPTPPVLKFFNVGNFEETPLEDFSFKASIKNSYFEGAAACQFVDIDLITNEDPIFFPLSQIGCVSELKLFNAGQMVSGKSADLSGFGVDLTSWVDVECRGSAKGIQYFVNAKKAFECPPPGKKMKIVGIAFLFQGTGSVKNISLFSGSKQIFSDFQHQ